MFDLLHLDGYTIRKLPYRTRRALLVDLLPQGDRWRLAPSWTQRHDDVVEVTRAQTAHFNRTALARLGDEDAVTVVQSSCRARARPDGAL